MIFIQSFYKPDVNTECLYRPDHRKINMLGLVNWAINTVTQGQKPL